MKDRTSSRTELRPGHRPPAHCSFCGKGQDRVKLVAGPSLEPGGPGVFICNECVELCREILAESEPPPAGSA